VSGKTGLLQPALAAVKNPLKTRAAWSRETRLWRVLGGVSNGPENLPETPRWFTPTPEDQNYLKAPGAAPAAAVTVVSPRYPPCNLLAATGLYPLLRGAVWV